MELALIANGQQFRQSFLYHKTSIKTLDDTVWRVSELVTMWSFGNSRVLGRVWRLFTLSPYFVLMHLLYLAVPELYPSIRNR